MRTLIVDHHDSFTFNLFQVLATLNGEPPVVVQSDALEQGGPDLDTFDNVLLSPGPGSPLNDGDFGPTRDLIRSLHLPVLGVCLGHQGLGAHFGARIVPAPQVMHGRLSAVFHDDSELWRGIPQGAQMVRYHSLTLATPLAEPLRQTAWTNDGVCMALAHSTLPIWGVQFHPESICSEHGERLLRNFRDLTHARDRSRVRPRVEASTPPPRPAAPMSATREVLHRKLERAPDAATLFANLFANSPNAFWLDSSRAETGLSRYSFLGEAADENRIAFDVTTGEVVRGGLTARESIYVFLERELSNGKVVPSAELPFEFQGGFVGYLGYELKALDNIENRHRSASSDAQFLRVERFVAVDHETGASYLVALHPNGDPQGARDWLDAMGARVAGLVSRDHGLTRTRRQHSPHEPSHERLSWSRSPSTYLADIASCERALERGDSYELCLTNLLHVPAPSSPLSTYLHLRTLNPAPYGAFLRLGTTSVLCSSPERFLKIGIDRWAESKPIKGTRPRGRTEDEDRRLAIELASNEKDRAENLMIVDLLRNDLGRVCTAGTVSVPKLMAVETYASVHHLVSTIRGQLASETSPVAAVQAAFPGGSMTGAPKRRSMQLLDEWEREARGVYSGALGYFSFTGAVDLNIVIRTLVVEGEAATIGVGGAIVALSDAQEELEETRVKARPTLRAWLLGEGFVADDAALERVLSAGEGRTKS